MAISREHVHQSTDRNPVRSGDALGGAAVQLRIVGEADARYR